MFSAKDGIVKVTVNEGPAKGQTFEIVSREKDSFDPGWKSTYGKGARGIVYIAEGVSEPKLAFDCSSAMEIAAKVVAAAVYSAGGTAKKASCTISHVFRRSGQTLAFRFTGCKLASGGGYDSDDSGVKGKMEWMMKKAEKSVNGGDYQVVT